MKKKLSLILTFVLLLTLPLGARAEADGPVTFSDPVFEAKLRAILERPEGDILASECAQFTELDLSNLDFSKEDWEDIPENVKIRDLQDLQYFPNLTKLEIGQNAISDLSPVAALKNLAYLDAPMNAITDLSPIAGLTNLEYAVFWRNGIADLSPVAHLTNLTVFSVFSNKVTDISALKGLTKLTTLELRDNPFTDYSPIAEIYPNLTNKDFELPGTQTDAPAAQSPYDPAEVIKFPDPALEAKVRAAIGKPEGDITAGDAAQVTMLDLSNQWQPKMPEDILIRDLTGLEYFVNVDKLSLMFNALTDLTPIKGLTGLAVLDFGGNQVSDLGPLANLTGLKSLSLFGNGISDISALAPLSNLELLYIHGNQIADISVLVGMKNLSTLRMSDNRISDLSPLAGLPITDLYLANNPIADYSPIMDIYPALGQKDFEILDASNVPDEPLVFQDPMFEKALRTAMGIYDRPITQKDAFLVTSIEIDNDKSEGAQFTDISPLAYFVNLSTLKFNSNLISDLKPLSGLTKLKQLNIGFNQVSDLSPLAGLSNLESLWLQNNLITDISPLANLTNLYDLNLADNQIADFTPIASLPRLGQLSLANNPGDVQVLKDIYPKLTDVDFELK